MKMTIMLLVVVLVLLGFYFIFRNTAETPTNPNTQKVLTYWYKATTNELVSVQIEIEKGNDIEKRTLEELLKGTQGSNISRSYGSAINQGVRIQNFKIENKVAYVDFNEELEKGMVESSMVKTIRGQIEKTLTQFDTIDSVIISINGRADGILQP